MATSKKSSKKKSSPSIIEKARKAAFDVKAFRSEIAKLKRKGLVSKKYDARKVTPTKYLKKQIKEFAAVLRGEATAVTIKKKETRKAYQETGYQTKGKKVIIPLAKNEKITVTHGKVVRTQKMPMGTYQHIDIPIKYVNLRQYLEDLRRSDFKLSKDEQFAFRFFGGESISTFANIEVLINKLMRYETIEDGLDASRKEQKNIYQNLEIFRVNKKFKWPPGETGGTPMNREYMQRYNERRLVKYHKQKASDLPHYDKRLAAMREVMRNKRANMTEAEKSAVREKDRVRRAAARAKAKGEKK